MYTFRKEERLCSRKHLDLLFKNGSSFLLYPFRVTYLELPDKHSFPARVVVNVPKRRYKHAVDRNLLKRRIREAYRHLKSSELYDLVNEEKHLLLSLQFVGKEKYPLEFIHKKLNLTLQKLVSKIKDHGTDQ
ncbi:ribonuclease P protein component [Pedobacter sp. SYP-B3415]|uniref:ribonuclease P protein component n=1 Tax=Pedobacter sp. SYP-B3415 TaxID=2496641 RepID=UPI00101C3892|nr:ribonuclease P protein component [Pedobacter sp. SYP-B3415]